MEFLRAGLGLLFFIAVAWLVSTHRRRVNIRVVIGGLCIQIALALIILQSQWGRQSLEFVSEQAAQFLSFGEEGANLVFGSLTGFQQIPEVDAGAPPEPVTWYSAYPFHLAPEEQLEVGVIFAFKALTTIIYFSAVMAILYYLGIMQIVISALARVMTWAMKVSGAESLAMAANVFVGQTEAPLVVKPYVKGMTRSELMAMMTGGFATIAGSVLAVYIGVLGSDFAGHLLAASFMSAPAAFLIAKIMVPETETSKTGGNVKLERQATEANVLEAAANGTSVGLQLFLNVLAMLISFVAIVALINALLGIIPMGENDPLTLQRIFGWLFAPVAWMMGVNWADCQAFGALLGTKVAVNEFVAFSDLSKVSSDSMSLRSQQMAAYALCGFANLGSIGIQIGGIGALVPERRQEIAALAPRAMLAGAMASWMTATIAGAFLA